MNKKGAELSVNVIIVAAIALAVLVVLFMIFTGRMGIFSKGVGETASCENACKALGKSKGEAVNKAECDGRPGMYIPGVYTDLSNKEYACCCSG